ncbi:BIRC2_3 [Mytilus coruscus]|uniref:BIRC2_3 n=1 Tax=Mytilus coruscus TaxID=42192 RepID=A0A6J8C3L3_MYTCO|nr:BIRC2_3 [Mytilus coruscus]
MHSPQFQTYDSRLGTLTQFPIQSQKVRELIAEAGCFSVNYLDYIQCSDCGACLRAWNIAGTDHSFYFEHCALREKKLEISDRIRSKEFRDRTIGASFDNIFTRMLTYTLLSSRNEYNVQHLMQFAQAGFYYLGTKEDTFCYSCYLGLTTINEHRNPWEVHNRFSPNCKHMKTLNEDVLKQFEEGKQISNT